MLDLPVRDLVDAAFRLFAEWSVMNEAEKKQLDNVYAYFRDRETEFETGEPVLPGWASIGNAAARYGPQADDGADPFATM